MDTYLDSIVALFHWLYRQLTPHYRFGEPDSRLTWVERGRTAAALAVVLATTLLYTGVGFGWLK